MFLIKGDTPSILLSALVSKYGRDYVDSKALKSLFYEIIVDEEADEYNIYAAYIGLAALREPILFDLNYLKKEERSYETESIYLALAYAFLGDYNTAREIYNKEIKKYDNYLDEEPYLLAILTSMIDINTSKALISQHINDKTYHEHFSFAIMAYIENTTTFLKENSSIDIDLNGNKEHIEITKMMIKKKIIEKKDVANIKITATKDVYVKTTYIGNYKDIKKEDLKYDVKSTIAKKLKKGQVTKLRIEIKKNEPETWGEIKIALPSGLRLSPAYEVKANNIYLSENRNDYLIFYAYDKNDTIIFDVDLVATSRGKFELEPVIFINDYKYGVSNSNIITIE